jgi:hypothetical protein
LSEVLDPANHLIASQSYASFATGDHSLRKINPNGPIKAGDTIYLLSGDHGSPTVRGYVNSGFITVEAAPGQVPIVGGMRIESSSHWIFRNLTFEADPLPVTPNWGPLLDVGLNDHAGPSDNIILDSNTIRTSGDSSTWSDSYWMERPYNFGVSTRANCTTLSGNHLSNFRNGLNIWPEATKTIVEANTIEQFETDGIDMTASDVTIRRNTIQHGKHNASDPTHADAIQGWTAKGATNSNVVVDGNTIINTPSDANYLMGISIYDGKWTHLTITNNVVVTNHANGITLLGIEDSEVINNTVVSSDPHVVTTLTIRDSKEHSPSSHVLIRNNIIPQMNLSGVDLTWDHNLAEKLIIISKDGRTAKYMSGRVGDENFIQQNIFSTLQEVDRINGHYDLRLQPNSRAIKAGNQEQAPPVDITGKERIAPIDIGAYAR